VGAVAHLGHEAVLLWISLNDLELDRMHILQHETKSESRGSLLAEGVWVLPDYDRGYVLRQHRYLANDEAVASPDWAVGLHEVRFEVSVEEVS